MEHRSQNDSPKIYVACLASYNAGQLHGEWILADQEPQEIQLPTWLLTMERLLFWN